MGSQPYEMNTTDVPEFDDTYIFTNECYLRVFHFQGKRLDIHAASFYPPQEYYRIDTCDKDGEQNQTPDDQRADRSDAYSFYFSSPDLYPSYILT
jgi:hypothetical protein